MFDNDPGGEPSGLPESSCVLDSLSDSDLLAELDRLNAACNALAAQRLQAIGAVDQRDTLQAWGFPHTGALLTGYLRMSPSEAKSLVHVAQDVAPRTSLIGEALPPRRPDVLDAAMAGDISPDHVKALAAAMRRIEPHATPEQCAGVEEALVTLARKAEPSRIAAAARYALSRFNPDGVEPDNDSAARRRGLTWKTRHDGMVDLRGVLTPECAAKLEAVLSPLAAPQPVDANGADVREPVQRRHDALEDLLDRFLRSGTLPDHGGVPLSVAVIVDLDDLRAEVGTATTTHGRDVDLPTLLRMAAEAEIVPVFMSKADGIVGYGTTKRLATANQTKRCELETAVVRSRTALARRNGASGITSSRSSSTTAKQTSGI